MSTLRRAVQALRAIGTSYRRLLSGPIVLADPISILAILGVLWFAAGYHDIMASTMGAGYNLADGIDGIPDMWAAQANQMREDGRISGYRSQAEIMRAEAMREGCRQLAANVRAAGESKFWSEYGEFALWKVLKSMTAEAAGGLIGSYFGAEGQELVTRATAEEAAKAFWTDLIGAMSASGDMGRTAAQRKPGAYGSLDKFLEQQRQLFAEIEKATAKKPSDLMVARFAHFTRYLTTLYCSGNTKQYEEELTSLAWRYDAMWGLSQLAGSKDSPWRSYKDIRAWLHAQVLTAAQDRACKVSETPTRTPTPTPTRTPTRTPTPTPVRTPTSTASRDPNCCQYRWYFYHTCKGPHGCCPVQLERTIEKDLRSRGGDLTIFGSYLTEKEALSAIGAKLGRTVSVQSPSGTCNGWQGDVGGQWFGIGAIVDLATGKARQSQPDADGDGVPDRTDRCSNTPSGTAADRSGCPCGACPR